MNDAAELAPDELMARRVWFAHLQGADILGVMSLTDRQWSILESEALRHQLGSLTYRLLADGPLADRVPASVQQRLRSRYLDYAVRNAVLLRHTAENIEALARVNIPVILLKGIHLCRFVYAEPALRTMADVDLMVPRNRLAEAEQVFLGRGYGPVPRPDLEEFCTWSNHLAKLHKEGAPVVELHWSIERPTSPFRIDLEGLWRRAIPAKLENTTVRLLAPEDLLLHLALHGSYHHEFNRSALKALIDVHAVITRHAAELNWMALAARANDWGAAGFVYTTLRLAQDILATPVPPAILQELDHDVDDDKVLEIARRFVLLPEVELPQRYLALATSPTLTARMRLLFRAVFLPPKSIEQMYGLRAGSLLVYPFYLWRVLDLVLRRGGLLLRAVFRTRTIRPALHRGDDKRLIESWVKQRAGSSGPDRKTGANGPHLT
jgi:hypothetical protein